MADDYNPIGARQASLGLEQCASLTRGPQVSGAHVHSDRRRAQSVRPSAGGHDRDHRDQRRDLPADRAAAEHATSRPGDPALAEYLRAVLPLLPPGTSVDAVLQQMSAYDLVVFRWGFRASDPSLVTLFTEHVPARRVHAPRRQHAVPVGVRQQRRAPPRCSALRVWYLATGVAATLFQTLFNPGSADPAGGGLGRDLRRSGLLPGVVPSPHGQAIRVPVSRSTSEPCA